jgi:hypothetical protein
VTVELSGAGRGSFWRVVSGGNLGSRLGFRGSEDLGGGLAAVFRIEAGINLDDGAAAQGGRAWGREASVSLASRDSGTLVAWRLPMPYNLALVAVDAFGWGGSGGQIAIGRNDPALSPMLALGLAARVDNALRYTSPSWQGLTLQAMASLGEDSTTIGRGAGFAARYTQGAIDAVVSTQRLNSAGNLGASGSVQLGASRVWPARQRRAVVCSTWACVSRWARPSPGLRSTPACRTALRLCRRCRRPRCPLAGAGRRVRAIEAQHDLRFHRHGGQAQRFELCAWQRQCATGCRRYKSQA